MRSTKLQVRTIAAIIVWIVVGLLLLNRILKSELVLPLAIILTIVALILYFSQGLMKKNNQLQPKNLIVLH